MRQIQQQMQEELQQQTRDQLTELANKLMGHGGSGNQDDRQGQQDDGSKDNKRNKEWNPEEIGLFDPEYEGTGSMINTGKTVFYHDVYAFTDRLNDMAIVRGEEELRTVIPQTLRGSALIWHSTELLAVEKEILRIATIA